MNYDDIIWTPLDIPEAPFNEWVYPFFKRLESNYYSVAVAGGGIPIQGTFEEHYKINTPQVEWKEDFKKSFPDLINYVKTYLPFEKFTQVIIQKQKSDIPPHLDYAGKPNKEMYEKGLNLLNFYDYINHRMDNEPSEYRILLNGIKTGSFYVCTTLDGSDKVYTKLPETTSAFAFNSQMVMHGADYIDQTKMTLIVKGWLDVNKHKELITRSVEKYSDNVLYKKDFPRLAKFNM